MLNKEEEQKLEMFFRIIETAREQFKFPQLGVYDIEWLTKKLKEINNEASKYSEELYKANKELADLREHYEG